MNKNGCSKCKQNNFSYPKIYIWFLETGDQEK